MRPLHRRLLILGGAILILIAGYVIYRFVAAANAAVPQDFSDARTQSGLISQSIVSNSNEIVTEIGEINTPTSTPQEVSSTIADILQKVTNIRTQAVQLSGQLTTMTQALPKIKSEGAQEAALTSISQQLALVGDLISYTEEVTELANDLQLHLESHVNNDPQIVQLIDQINGNVNAINNFNRLANQSMQQFDSLLQH